MELLGKIGLLFVIASALARSALGSGHCDLPATWYDDVPLGKEAEEWWCEYDSQTSDLIVYTFTEETIASAFTGLNGSCVDKYDSTETDFTIVLFNNNGFHFCVEAWAVDRTMMIAFYEPGSPTALTIEDCKDYFSSRVNWHLWINVPFQTPFTPHTEALMPFENGDYILSYRFGHEPEDNIHCDFDGTTIDSTLTLTDNQIISTTCNGFQNSFTYPLNSLMLVIGVATDAEVLPEGEAAASSGFLMLAYPAGSSRYNFYCARYTVIEDYLEITLMLESPNYANCYAREEDYPATFETTEKYLALQLRSTECLTDTPCQNGGTCIQMWNDYVCQCPVGFVGKSCEFDLSDCDPWATWGRCSKPCGGCGDKARTRTCPEEFPTGPGITEETKSCGVKKCIKGVHNKIEIIGYKTSATGRKVALIQDRQCCYNFSKDPPKELPASKACIRKAASGWRWP